MGRNDSWTAEIAFALELSEDFPLAEASYRAEMARRAGDPAGFARWGMAHDFLLCYGVAHRGGGRVAEGADRLPPALWRGGRLE